MSDHTPGPWVQFAIDGKPDAIMPAMREGDICTFRQPPTDADARLMTLAPALLNMLKRLLNTIDSGSWRDRTELSIAAHPAVDDARELIAAVSAPRESASE